MKPFLKIEMTKIDIIKFYFIRKSTMDPASQYPD